MSDKKFNNKQLAIGLAVLLAVGGSSFYGGLKYGESKAAPAGARFQVFGQGAQRGGASAGTQQRANRGGGFVSGDIMSVDDKSLTIKSRDGGSRIILLSGSTEVSKFSAGALSDLQVGDSVTVTGKTNTDGSITAQTIQERPAMPEGFQGGPNGMFPPNGGSAPATR